MQRISLFGYGKTTKALCKNFPLEQVIFYDDKVHKPFKDEYGYRVYPSNDFIAEYSDLEIPSPGIPPYNPLIQKAKNLQSDYDFFANIMPPNIWISGTNGKTTTTQMMQHLLADKGSVMGGNIGTPLAELNPQASLWILETSSFTMHYTNIATPSIYILLPLSPDHLSWHGDMDAYIQTKLKPLYTMQEGEIAIIPKAYENTPTNASLICYSSDEELANIFGIDLQTIKFKGAFLTDALLAMAVDKILFDRVSYEKINSFVLDPHRQEELRDTHNRLWVNDTKATNIDATLAALQRYKDSYIHLILGGDDKGVDLSELFEYLANKKLSIYAIGANKEKIMQLASIYNVASTLCHTLEKAVQSINKVMAQGDIALLSPAAASLDQFSSYAQRGDLFKECVVNIS